MPREVVVQFVQHRTAYLAQCSHSRLGEGRYSIGIPKGTIVKYEAALKTDQFLLIVHGSAAEVSKAKEIIETTNPSRCSLHTGEAAKAATS